jgi:hypothetical protein
MGTEGHGHDSEPADTHAEQMCASGLLVDGRQPLLPERRESPDARQDYLMRQLQKLNPGCVITITPTEAA